MNRDIYAAELRLIEPLKIDKVPAGICNRYDYIRLYSFCFFCCRQCDFFCRAKADV